MSGSISRLKSSQAGSTRAASLRAYYSEPERLRFVAAGSLGHHKGTDKSSRVAPNSSPKGTNLSVDISCLAGPALNLGNFGRSARGR